VLFPEGSGPATADCPSQES